MNQKRLLELAGVLTEEATTEEYPVVVDTVTAKDVFADFEEHVQMMIGDDDLPEGTEFTKDMITDKVMKKFVEGLEHMYKEGGSDDSQSEMYRDAVHDAIMLALGK
jgi:hypothetical protein